MKPIDKHYLLLQFWNKLYQKNATEFQSFFEDIMQEAFPDFQKIRPYGNQGDRYLRTEQEIIAGTGQVLEQKEGPKTF